MPYKFIYKIIFKRASYRIRNIETVISRKEISVFREKNFIIFKMYQSNKFLF